MIKRVKCINKDSNDKDLTVGNIYYVYDMDLFMFYIKDDYRGNHVAYRRYKFEIVEYDLEAIKTYENMHKENDHLNIIYENEEAKLLKL